MAGWSVWSNKLVPLGEAAEVYQMAAAATGGHSGPHHLKVDNSMVTEDKEVETAVISFFEALFQGHHIATAARPEPFHSGMPFEPYFSGYQTFTADMPALSQF
jgi:hypothetical protein